MMRPSWFFLCLTLGAMGIPLSGCGDDPPAQSPRRRSSKKKKKKAKVAKPKGPDLSKLPKKLQSAQWQSVPELAKRLRDARDPFKPYLDDLIVEEVQEAVIADDNRLETKIPEPPARLQLIAIITGTAVHRAMVKDSDGLGHIVRPGDMIGDDVPYRVARITRNEILFQPIQPPTAEKKLEDVRKVLLTQEELEELLP